MSDSLPLEWGETRHTSLYKLLRAHAGQNPDAPAIMSFGRKPLTYLRLLRQVAETVKALRSAGVGRRDRVALVLPPGPDAAVATLAVASGATCAPLNPGYRVGEFISYFADLCCRALLVPAGSTSPAVTAAKARGIPVMELLPIMDAEAGIFNLDRGVPDHSYSRLDFSGPNDIALALHTTGTTTRPKQVLLTHKNICASACSILDAVKLVETDRCLSVMPLFHIHGLSAILASIAARACVVCMGDFSAGEFFQNLQSFRPTWYTAAPAIHKIILEYASDHPGIAERTGLKFIRSASSAMPHELRMDLEHAFRVPVIEAYGMTEAAPQIASNRLPPATSKPGSVGRAAGPEVAIMNEAGCLVLPGHTGEIVVRGPNVIRGYGNRPEADATAFVKGWLRTGDIGYLDLEGDLFITGRLKEIINRGGEKISPNEVEEVLLQHASIAQAAVFAIPHPTLGEDIGAAVVLRANTTVTEAELRSFILSRLASFKTPRQIALVDRIPLGATGKLERMNLAVALGLASPHFNRTSSEPTSEIERAVAKIWADILGIERPGRHDNFFRCGGHSLSAIQVLARFKHEFGVELRNDIIFAKPTVAELAESVVKEMSLDTERSPFSFHKNARPALLSFAQERLWFLDQMEPGNPAYNICSALWLTGGVDRSALEQSLGEIQRRHEALRTRFEVSDREPVQVISPFTADLRLMDLTGLSPGDGKETVLRLAAEDAGRPFDLASGPLFRTSLLQLGSEEHVLLITMHHIVSDRWSIGVIHRELSTLYASFAAGQPPVLPELTWQYADFAAWQRRRLPGKILDKQLGFWKRQLAELPPAAELPVDRPRPAIQTFRGARVSLTFSSQLTEDLKKTSSGANVTLFMTMMAAFQTLLMRTTGQVDLMVGIPIANRTRLETETMIGFFANTLVLRTDLSGDPTFRELLERVKAVACGAYAHQDLPFEKLVQALHPLRDPANTPLFRIMFAFQNVPEAATEVFELAPGLTARPLAVDGGKAKFDLTVYLWETRQGLHTVWQYNSELYNAETIARLAGRFQKLSAEIAADSTLRLSEIPLFTETERRELEAEWGRTSAPHLAGGLFHHLFEQQVEQTPDAVALEYEDERLSYRELNIRANQLARYLQKLGLGAEDRVGICLPRSTQMIVALLGVLKAGAAYIALDPDTPSDRLVFMQEDARPRVLITETPLLRRLHPGNSVAVVRLDTDQEVISQEDSANSESAVTGKNLAYIIYTSGSTGTPKGVMITHANLYHCARAMGATLGVTPTDRYLHTASFGFSSSVRQLAVPLGCGAAVILCPSDCIRDPQTVMRLIRDKRVSIIDFVPSFLRVCLHELQCLAPAARMASLDNDLRLILSASEPLAINLTREWLKILGHRIRLINMYGQTETTGIVTAYEFQDSASIAGTGVPIGSPIPNMRVYVLDQGGRPVPAGVLGEVYAAGAGVGAGYLNYSGNPFEQFLPDPFYPGERMCRTGDLARFRQDGTLEFLGRDDEQIKIRGYRIEPGEIEDILGRHPGVYECAVLAAVIRLDQPQLVAYVVPCHGAAGHKLAKELHSLLKQKLPTYMLPNSIVELNRLPRSVTGKVDRNALLAHFTAEGTVPPTKMASPAGFVAPRTHIEKILAEIWREELHLAHVGVEDNFFDLGGDSLLSIRMIRRATEAGLRLNLKQLFQHQTVAELARVVGTHDDFPDPDRQPGLRPAYPNPKARREETMVTVAVESLRAYGREALEQAGLNPEGAAIVTEVQIEASLRGQPTHNMDSIPRYARQILAGALSAKPRIRIEHETRISAQIDGDNGPGQWVASMAMETAIGKARQSGIGVVGVRRSNHFGAAGHYVWMAARQGLIGLCTTNGPLILSPSGGITPIFGNNPLAAGIPAGHYPPIILDIAMSVAPRGKIGLRLAEGKPLPPGWILDRFGRPSTDPADLAAGLGVPIGGHKGYGLALIMEALAGVLPGAGFCQDHRRERMKDGSKPRDIGHFFIVIDPELFSPAAEFIGRVDRLIEQTKAARPMENVDEILIPGEAELRARERNLKYGVPLRPVTYRSLMRYKTSARLSTPLAALQQGSEEM